MSGQVGPNIPLDGLEIYYDFSNPKSYPGSGNTVYNLGSYTNVNAILSGSIAGGLPTFVSNKLSSYISFASSGQQYMFYTLPTWGTSFTQISIYASPTSTWDGDGDIGGNRMAPTSLTSNGWVSFINTAGDVLTGNAIELATYTYNIINYVGSNITLPGFYALGYDNPTSTAITGFNNNISDSVRAISPSARTPINNSQVYFARITPAAFIDYGSRFTSVKLYLHMLYNRKLSVNEVNLIYRTLQRRFNF